MIIHYGMDRRTISQNNASRNCTTVAVWENLIMLIVKDVWEQVGSIGMLFIVRMLIFG